jgi:hypothetical protein
MGICSDQGIQRIGSHCNKSLVLNYNQHSADILGYLVDELKNQ